MNDSQQLVVKLIMSLNATVVVFDWQRSVDTVLAVFCLLDFYRNCGFMWIYAHNSCKCSKKKCFFCIECSRGTLKVYYFFQGGGKF